MADITLTTARVTIDGLTTTELRTVLAAIPLHEGVNVDFWVEQTTYPDRAPFDAMVRADAGLKFQEVDTNIPPLGGSGVSRPTAP